MKTAFKLIVLAFLACSPLSYGAGIGAYWASIDAEDLGESEGLGARLNLQLDRKSSIDIRFTQFDDFDATNGIGSYEITPVEGLYLINLNPISGLKPYVGGGFGYYQQEATDLTGAKIDLDDEFGWMLVGGITFELGNSIHIFGEAVYRKVEGKVDGAQLSIDGVDSDNAELDMAGIGFNAGIMLRW